MRSKRMKKTKKRKTKRIKPEELRVFFRTGRKPELELCNVRNLTLNFEQETAISVTPSGLLYPSPIGNHSEIVNATITFEAERVTKILKKPRSRK